MKSFSAGSKAIVFLYSFFAFSWFLFILLTGHTEHSFGFYFQIPLAIIPLLGGIIGLRIAKGWGGFQSVMGKAISGISLGLLTWGGGMIIWNYYIFFTDIEVPYPSLADALFILSWPLWSYGVYELSKVIGAKFGLREKNGKAYLFLVPVIIAAASYYLLFVVARGGEIDLNVSGLQLFFDLFYPIGTAFITTVVAVVYSLSRRFLGGKYKYSILILFLGFLVNFISDFTFSYTTTTETYFNGHFVDFLLMTAMFLLSLGVANMEPTKK